MRRCTTTTIIYITIALFILTCLTITAYTLYKKKYRNEGFFNTFQPIFSNDGTTLLDDQLKHNKTLWEHRDRFIGAITQNIIEKAKANPRIGGPVYKLCTYIEGSDNSQNIKNGNVSLLPYDIVQSWLNNYVMLPADKLDILVENVTVICDDFVYLYIKDQKAQVMDVYTKALATQQQRMGPLLFMMNGISKIKESPETTNLISHLEEVTTALVGVINEELDTVLCILYSADGTRLYTKNTDEFGMTSEQRDKFISQITSGAEVNLKDLLCENMRERASIWYNNISPSQQQFPLTDVILKSRTINSYNKTGLPKDIWITSSYIYHYVICRLFPYTFRMLVLLDLENQMTSGNEHAHLMQSLYKQASAYITKDIAEMRIAQKALDLLIPRILSFLQTLPHYMDVRVSLFTANLPEPEKNPDVQENIKAFLFTNDGGESIVYEYIHEFTDYYMSLTTLNYQKETVSLSVPSDYITSLNILYKTDERNVINELIYQTIFSLVFVFSKYSVSVFEL